MLTFGNERSSNKCWRKSPLVSTICCLSRPLQQERRFLFLRKEQDWQNSDFVNLFGDTLEIMTQTSEPSLRRLFNQAKNQQDELDSLDPRSANFKDTLQSIIDNLQQCHQLMQQLSLFSTNEEVEDIATQDLQYGYSCAFARVPLLMGDIRYLTVDCLLAEMEIKAYGADRLSSLRKANALFESFLTTLDQYRLLAASDRELFERFLEQPNSFRIVASDNAEDKRRIKIARFQEEKSLKQKLQVCGHTYHIRINPNNTPVSPRRVAKNKC